jgi:hypothetical protein
MTGQVFRPTLCGLIPHKMFTEILDGCRDKSPGQRPRVLADYAPIFKIGGRPQGFGGFDSCPPPLLTCGFALNRRVRSWR